MGKEIHFQVTTMDVQFPVTIQDSALGSELFQVIVQKIGLGQSSDLAYFGLEYIDDKEFSQWIKLNKKLGSKKFKDSPIKITFKIKIFPLDPTSQLTHQDTTRLLYLQLKQSIELKQFNCPPETLATLKQLTVNDVKMIEYVNIVSKLEDYGVHFFHTKEKTGKEMLIGIDPMGIGIFEGPHKKVKEHFSWTQTANISFNDRKFIIKLTNHETRIYFQNSLKVSKKILTLSMDHHQMFMAGQAQAQLKGEGKVQPYLGQGQGQVKPPKEQKLKLKRWT